MWLNFKREIYIYEYLFFVTLTDVKGEGLSYNSKIKCALIVWVYDLDGLIGK
jgi:hypothetical protein